MNDNFLSSSFFQVSGDLEYKFTPFDTPDYFQDEFNAIDYVNIGEGANLYYLKSDNYFSFSEGMIFVTKNNKEYLITEVTENNSQHLLLS